MIRLIKSTFYRESHAKKQLCRFITGAKQLSFGKQCELFEKEFASWQDRKHCVMLNSGSSANLAIIQSLLNLGMLSAGDRVGFSAVTWSTNVMPLMQLGLTPVPVDVDLNTLNISSSTLKSAIGRQKIKMLFITNLLGFSGDVDVIRNICREHGILLIEDNCEALGSVYRGRKLGNFGLASTFSFYVGHHMSTVEGGAVCTDNEELATMLALVRAHGWDRNLSFSKQTEIRKKFRVNSTFYSRYTFYDLGFNFRPTEIAGFLGLHQLKYLDEIVRIRQENFLRISSELYTLTGRYHPVEHGHMDTISNFAIPLICKTKEIRDDLVKLCDGKVEIRPIVGGNMTQQPFFSKYAKKSASHCPNATRIHEYGLYFGNNPELTQKEISTLIRIFSG